MQGRAETAILRRGGSRGEKAGKPKIQPFLSEIEGRSPDPSGAHDGTPRNTQMSLSTPLPGSSPWARRLTAKKKCATCREECCQCPYTAPAARNGKEAASPARKRAPAAKPAPVDRQAKRTRDKERAPEA